MRIARWSSVVVLAAGCGASPAAVRPAGIPGAGVNRMPVAQSVYLRASFDEDPSEYLGSYVRRGTAPADLDETASARTRCSRFIAHDVIKAGGTYDETFQASRGVMGSLGIAQVADLSAGSEATAGLRVKYAVTAKMRASVTDEDELDRCCKAAPDQCSDLYIGEFIRGTGELFQFEGAETDVKAGGSYQLASAELEFKDGFAWRRVTRFDDVYFAFRTRASNTGAASGESAEGCGWAYDVPTSLDGKYFVGVSPPAASETQARDRALRDARLQAVRFAVGEELAAGGVALDSVVEGVIEDVAAVAVESQGTAKRVEDRKWCPAEREDTPHGVMLTMRVLAFVSSRDLDAIAGDAASAVAKGLEEKGHRGPGGLGPRGRTGRVSP